VTQHRDASDPPAGGRAGWRERLAWHALGYGIPAAGMRWFHFLGGLTLASALALVGTGLWLAQFYNPNPIGAHDSVVYIVTRAPLGDVVRSLHAWAATAMVASLVAHLAVVFVRRCYVRPREVTWWTGAGMAAAVFLLAVTGTVLRYDQEGFEALAHLRAGAELAGPLGAPFREDFAPSAPVLARVFQWHTSLLPLVLFGLLALHLWLVRHLGLRAAEPPSVPFARHLRKLAGAACVLVAALGALALLVPEDLGYPPVPSVEVTKPFWPLLWVYGLENLFGLHAMVWGPLAVFGFLALVPVLDREGAGPGRRRAAVALGAAILGGALVLGLYAAIAPAQQHLM
jgi:quinol-cytochrome oxidoreductase complex cytochrome b subunit